MKAKLLLIAGLLFIVTITKSQNIIKDGSFSTTTTIQSYFIFDETNAPAAGVWWAWQNWQINAGATVNSGVCKYQLNSIGYQKNIWDIQLNQTGFALIKGHSYRLTFDVWADAERSFGVYLGQDGGWWHGYLSEAQHKQIATTVSKKKTIEFVADEVFPSHKLSFELGEEKTDTYFDNVVLQDLSVTNTNTGFSYSTIQGAIDAPETLNGHTLVVAPGVYAENVLVNKELTINGPKMGVDGNDVSRGSGEAVLYPPTVWYGDGTYNGGYLIRVTADNVTIDGLTLNGDNPALTGVYGTNHGDFDIDFGIMSYWSPWYEYPYVSPEGYDASGDLAGDNLKIKNNVLRNFKWLGIYLQSDYYNPNPKIGEVLHNKIENAAIIGVFLMQNYYANVDYNTIDNSQKGIVFYFFWLGKSSSSTGTVNYNTIRSSTIIANWGDTYTGVNGISAILLYNNIPLSWEISNNSLSNSSIRSSGSVGLASNINWTPTALSISNNNITGYESGYDIRSSGDGGEGLTPAPTQALTVTGGTVSNCKYGVWATNLSAYGGTAQSAMYNINQISFLNNTDAGIFVDDQSANPINLNPSTVAAHANNCRFFGNSVGIKLSGTYAYGSAHNNDISGASSFAINNLSPNTVDATCNWYGHWTGPTNTGNPGGMGTKVSSNVSFDPWVTNGTDYNLTLPGFQPAPGSCVPIKCGNKNKSYLFCHKGKTICTGYDDALIHIGHGDAFGACPGSPFVNSAEKVTDETSVLPYKVSNFPNPFSSSTRIQYQLPEDSKVMLKVFDMTGKEVMVLVNSDRKAGLHSVDFNASSLGSGIYYYKLTANSKDKEYVQTGKLVKQ